MTALEYTRDRRWSAMSRRLMMGVAALFAAAAASAQTPSGAVSGTARSETDSTPIPFALVRLLPSDSTGAPARQGITNAQGRFQFASIPPGTYRVQLLRIGYRPVVSRPLDVRDGATTDIDLRASMVGLPLPAVMVYGDDACVTGDRVASDPYLSTVWEDVRKGVEIRRAFDERYRYRRELTQFSETSVPSRPVARRERRDTVLSEPDSVAPRDERLRARRKSEGFGKGNTLMLPDERELLDDTFLTTHCLVPTLLAADGATGIQFRQTSKARRGFGLQGTIWFDSTTRLIRRLALEYLNGDERISEVGVEYADIPVSGTHLRLAAAGSFALRPVDAPRGTTVAGKLAFTYWGFEDIRPR
jgi:carboxypeptidase family protein